MPDKIEVLVQKSPTEKGKVFKYDEMKDAQAAIREYKANGWYAEIQNKAFQTGQQKALNEIQNKAAAVGVKFQDSQKMPIHTWDGNDGKRYKLFEQDGKNVLLRFPGGNHVWDGNGAREAYLWLKKEGLVD